MLRPVRGAAEDGEAGRCVGCCWLGLSTGSQAAQTGPSSSLQAALKYDHTFTSSTFLLRRFQLNEPHSCAALGGTLLR